MPACSELDSLQNTAYDKDNVYKTIDQCLRFRYEVMPLILKSGDYGYKLRPTFTGRFWREYHAYSPESWRQNF